MEHEQRRSKFGNYVMYGVVALVVSASGLVGADLEQVADELLAELGRIIDSMGSDPPPPAQAAA